MAIYRKYNKMSSDRGLVTGGSLGPLAAMGADSEESPSTTEGSVVMFNCTKIPGICKPMDFYTLGVVQNMQRQLNRVAHARNLKKIAVDGDVGPGTRELTLKAGIPYGMMTVAELANHARETFTAAKAMADALNAPATVSGPPSLAPASIVDKSGTIIKAPAQYQGASLLDAFSGMSTPVKLLVVGLFGGIGYMGYKELKKGKRK